MTDTNAPPSANPASESSLAGLLGIAIRKTLQGLDTMLPAKVIAYDRASNRAMVQPLIMIGTTTGEKVSRASVASVPVYQAAGGGFVMSFPLVPGDLGWIKANDRDISLFLQSLTEEWPNTARQRSFADGVFYPDRLRQFALNGEDLGSAVLQSEDGSTRIAIAQGTIKVAAPAGLRINGNTEVIGNLTSSTGATGTFSTGTGQIVTVSGGIITNIS